MILTCNMDSPDKIEKLAKSCDLNGYTLTTYGNGVWFKDYRQAKIDLLLEALKNISNKYVCYVDGWDSWMLRPGIVSKFLYMDSPIVIAGNRSHFPDTELYDLENYPESPTSFKYVCSSQFIGYRKELIKAFEMLKEYYVGYTDQEAWNFAHVHKLFEFQVDHRCQLFLNMTDVENKETFYNGTRLVIKETMTQPFNIHFGGPKGDSPNGQMMNLMYAQYLNCRQ